MELGIIITASVLAGLAIVWILLRLFVRGVLKNDARRLNRLVLILLVVQFILGMTANLWVTIPDSQPWIVFHQVGPILLHTINALLLLDFSIMSLALAVKDGRRVGVAASGLASVILAFASGLLFVNAGQIDLFSFTMALGFLGAFLSFGYRAFSPTQHASGQLVRDNRVTAKTESQRVEA